MRLPAPIFNSVPSNTKLASSSSKPPAPTITTRLLVRFSIVAEAIAAEVATSRVLTSNSPAIVTLVGNPTITLTSVPTLVTAVSISLAVPRICRSSVNKSTLAVPVPPSMVRAVATEAEPAAVSLP